MKKENWITKVEQSSDGMSKLEPSNDVWKKIQATITKTREITFTPKQVFAIAASLLVLISMNVSLLYASRSSKADSEVSLLENQVENKIQDNIYGEL